MSETLPRPKENKLETKNALEQERSGILSDFVQKISLAFQDIQGALVTEGIYPRYTPSTEEILKLSEISPDIKEFNKEKVTKIAIAGIKLPRKLLEKITKKKI